MAAVDCLDVEASVATHVKRQNLVPLHQPVDHLSSLRLKATCHPLAFLSRRLKS